LEWEDVVPAKISFINPKGLNKPPSYTQVVEISAPARIIYISGQLGTDADGGLVSSDFRAQAVQAFDNLQAALAAGGARFPAIVTPNSYLADVADLPILREVRAGHLNAEALPASTTLQVSRFARDGALLEIEAVVALPARAGRAKAPAARAASR